MADGRILIDTKIDTSGIEDGWNEVVQFFGRMAQKAEGLKKTVTDSFSSQTDSIMKTVKAYKDQKKAVGSVEQKQEKLIEQQTPTDGYKKLGGLLKETEEKIKAITDQQQKWVDTGFPIDSEAFASTDAELEKLYFTMKKIQQQQEEMQANGTAFTGGGGAETPASSALPTNQTEGMAGSFGRLKDMIAEYGTSLQTSSGYVNAFKASMDGLRIVLTRTVPLLGKGIFTGLLSGLKSLAKAAQKAALTLAQLAGRGIIGGLKKIATGIFGLDKAARKSNAGLGASLKTILKYGLGIRSLFTLVNKLRSAVKEGMKNLAQYSNNTNTTLSGLISSLDQCKNALATAFDPILQAIAPALNYMISLVTAAATAVAQLIAILTGKGTFIKATKVQKDYAKSLKATGGAAKGAGEDAEGALAPFDKLNVMAEEAASGGGGGAADLSPSDMFETVEVGDSFKELAALFKSKDWKGIGEYVAGQLNAGLQKIYDVIHWDNVGPRVTYFVNAFSETFNSLADKLDWGLLGRTIGTGINTIVNTLNLLIEGIDWENLGTKLSVGFRGFINELDWGNLGNLLGSKFMIQWDIFTGFIDDMWRKDDLTGLSGWSELGKHLADGLNRLFERIDLGKIGATLGNAITGIFEAGIDFAKTFDWIALGENIADGINGFFENLDVSTLAEGASEIIKGLLDSLITVIEKTDWQEIGNKVSDFIGNIDYSGISDKLFEGIGVALASLTEFIWGLIEDAWDNVVMWWEENAYEDGQFTMSGLLDGILEGLKNIGTWIKEHIFEPFIKGFKNAFGIHSPSTEMKEMGGYLIDGLKQGISDFIPNLMEKFSEIKNKISDVWDEVKKDASDKWDGIKKIVDDAITFIKGLIDSAMDAINDLLGRTENLEKNAKGPIGQLSSGPHRLTGCSLSAMSFIPSAEPVTLPRLASGTVVPPRAGEFAAILGDNRRETEVVSPLSTMQEALKKAILEVGSMGGGDITAHIYLDGRELGKSTVKFVREEKRRTGMNPLLV